LTISTAGIKVMPRPHPIIYGNTGCGVFKWGVNKIRKIFAYKSTYHSKEIIEF